MEEIIPKMQTTLGHLNDQVQELIRISYNCNENLNDDQSNVENINEIKESNYQTLDDLNEGYNKHYVELSEMIQTSAEDLLNQGEKQVPQDNFNYVSTCIKWEYQSLVEFLESRCPTDVIEEIENSINKITSNQTANSNNCQSRIKQDYSKFLSKNNNCIESIKNGNNYSKMISEDQQSKFLGVLTESSFEESRMLFYNTKSLINQYLENLNVYLINDGSKIRDENFVDFRKGSMDLIEKLVENAEQIEETFTRKEVNIKNLCDNIFGLINHMKKPACEVDANITEMLESQNEFKQKLLFDPMAKEKIYSLKTSQSVGKLSRKPDFYRSMDAKNRQQSRQMHRDTNFGLQTMKSLDRLHNNNTKGFSTLQKDSNYKTRCFYSGNQTQPTPKFYNNMPNRAHSPDLLNNNGYHQFEESNSKAHEGVPETLEKQFLQKIQRLERKADDRKVSLKQLFKILSLKEKEIEKWKNLINALKHNLVHKVNEVVSEMETNKEKTESLILQSEKKVKNMSVKLYNIMDIRKEEIRTLKENVGITLKNQKDKEILHQKDLFRLNDNYQKLEIEKQELLNENRDTKDSLGKHKSLLLDKEEETTSLNKDMLESKNDVAKKKEFYQNNINEYKTKIKNLREKVQELEKFRDDYSYMKENLSLVQNEKNNLVKKIESERQKSTELLNRLSTVENSKLEIESKWMQLNSVINQNEAKLKILKRENDISLNEYKNKYERCQNEYDFLMEGNSRLESKILDKEDEILQLSENKLQTEKVRKDLEFTKASLENELKYSKKQIDSQELIITELREKNMSEYVSLSDMKCKNEIISKENSALKNNLKIVEAFNNNNDDYLTINNDLESKIETVTSENTSLKQKFLKMRSEDQSQKKNNEEVISQNQDLTKKLNDLYKKMNTEKIEDFINNHEELKKMNENLESHCNQLEDTLKNTEKNLADKNNLLQQTLDDNQNLKQENQQLTEINLNQNKTSQLNNIRDDLQTVENIQESEKIIEELHFEIGSLETRKENEVSNMKKEYQDQIDAIMSQKNDLDNIVQKLINEKSIENDELSQVKIELKEYQEILKSTEQEICAVRAENENVMQLNEDYIDENQNLKENYGTLKEAYDSLEEKSLQNAEALANLSKKLEAYTTNEKTLHQELVESSGTIDHKNEEVKCLKLTIDKIKNEFEELNVYNTKVRHESNNTESLNISHEIQSNDEKESDNDFIEGFNELKQTLNKKISDNLQYIQQNEELKLSNKSLGDNLLQSQQKNDDLENQLQNKINDSQEKALIETIDTLKVNIEELKEKISQYEKGGQNDIEKETHLNLEVSRQSDEVIRQNKIIESADEITEALKSKSVVYMNKICSQESLIAEKIGNKTFDENLKIVNDKLNEELIGYEIKIEEMTNLMQELGINSLQFSKDLQHFKQEKEEFIQEKQKAKELEITNQNINKEEIDRLFKVIEEKNTEIENLEKSIDQLIKKNNKHIEKLGVNCNEQLGSNINSIEADALLQSWRSYETYGNSEDFREKNVRKVHQLSQKCEKLTEELNNTNLENQEKLIKIELLKNNISDLQPEFNKSLANQKQRLKNDYEKAIDNLKKVYDEQVNKENQSYQLEIKELQSQLEEERVTLERIQEETQNRLTNSNVKYDEMSQKLNSKIEKLIKEKEDVRQEYSKEKNDIKTRLTNEIEEIRQANHNIQENLMGKLTKESEVVINELIKEKDEIRNKYLAENEKMFLDHAKEKEELRDKLQLENETNYIELTREKEDIRNKLKQDNQELYIRLTNEKDKIRKETSQQYEDLYNKLNQEKEELRSKMKRENTEIVKRLNLELNMVKEDRDTIYNDLNTNKLVQEELIKNSQQNEENLKANVETQKKDLESANSKNKATRRENKEVKAMLDEKDNLAKEHYKQEVNTLLDANLQNEKEIVNLQDKLKNAKSLKIDSKKEFNSLTLKVDEMESEISNLRLKNDNLLVELEQYKKNEEHLEINIGKKKENESKLLMDNASLMRKETGHLAQVKQIELEKEDLLSNLNNLTEQHNIVLEQLEKIKIMDPENFKKGSTVNNLEIKVTEKGEEIQSLQTTLRQNTIELDNLYNSLAQKDQVVANFNSEQEQKNSIIENNDKQIQKLVENNKNLKTETERLKADYKTLKTQIEKINGLNEKLQKVNNNLNRDLEQAFGEKHEQVLKNQKEENHELIDEIEQYKLMKNQLIEVTEENHNLKTNISNKDKKITNLSSKLKDCFNVNIRDDENLDESIDLNEINTFEEKVQLISTLNELQSRFDVTQENYTNMKNWTLYLIEKISAFIVGMERFCSIQVTDCLSKKELDEMDVNGITQEMDMDEQHAIFVCILCNENRDAKYTGKKFAEKIKKTSLKNQEDAMKEAHEFLLKENVLQRQDLEQISKNNDLLKDQMQYLKDEYIKKNYSAMGTDSDREFDEIEIMKSHKELDRRLGSFRQHSRSGSRRTFPISLEKWDEIHGYVRNDQKVSELMEQSDVNMQDKDELIRLLNDSRNDLLHRIGETKKKIDSVEIDYSNLRENYSKLQDDYGCFVETNRTKKEDKSSIATDLSQKKMQIPPRPHLNESYDTQQSEERYKQIFDLTKKQDQLRIEYDTLQGINEELKSRVDSVNFSYQNLQYEMEIKKKQEETYEMQKEYLLSQNKKIESQFKANIRHIFDEFFKNVMSKQTKDTKLQSQEMQELLLNMLEYKPGDRIRFTEMLKTGKFSANVKKNMN